MTILSSMKLRLCDGVHHNEGECTTDCNMVIVATRPRTDDCDTKNSSNREP